MKTEQELIERIGIIAKELLVLNENKLPHWNYKRRMLLKEYNVLHWVLFE